MPSLLVLALFVGILSSQGAPADTPTPTVHPILVELFTSEGCSSCPPADALLEKLDGAEPSPGAQLIVLSEHVDYWDHDGWKNPASSAAMTERQASYVHALGLHTPYTPQMIVDGSTVVHMDDPKQIIRVFQDDDAKPKNPVRIDGVSVDADDSVERNALNFSARRISLIQICGNLGRLVPGYRGVLTAG